MNNHNEEFAQYRINELVRLIKYYDYEFHIKCKQWISEYERDKMREELMNLEQQFPQFIRNDSPTMVIGVVEENRHLINRKIPMLSLEHSYEKSIIEKWINDKKNLNYDQLSKSCDYLINNTFSFLNNNSQNSTIQEDFILEHKFDGVAVSAEYIDGILDSLSLRGDGYNGEDITSFSPYIDNLPSNLHHKICVTIRGEVCLPKNHKDQNKRSLIAGYFRQKVPNYKYAQFIPYGIIVDNNCYVSGYKSVDFTLLSQFMNIQPYITCSADNILKHMETFTNDNYETDGIVIKINRNVNLGSTIKYTKNAIAYKFNNQLYSCVVNNIQWDINRFGIFIPVIVINPIIIDGSKITNITGYNRRYLEQNEIGINSILEIERVGNTVPQVKNVLHKSNIYNIPNYCNYCNNKLEITDIHIQCNNELCCGVIYKRILNFFKDIKGLSQSIIQRIMPKNQPYLQTLEEIIQILLQKNWITSKHDQNVYEQFNIDRKTITYEQFIEFLGIKGVSKFQRVKCSTLERMNDYINNNNDKLNSIYKLIIS
jgi:DNA ligase (NAD+)